MIATSATSPPGSAWRQDWGRAVEEAAIDPGRRLVDAHHHLWPSRQAGMVPAGPYLAADLVRDFESGHDIVASVAVECGTAYRVDLGDELRSTGETAFFAEQAAVLESIPGAPRLAGIVAHFDLRRGAAVSRVIDAHREAGRGLLRGVRQMAAYDPRAPLAVSPIAGDLYADAGFRDGVRAAGRAGLVVDAWHFHTQAADFGRLVQSCPDVRFVLDHYGTPLGTGYFASRTAEVFADWRRGLAALAARPNLFVKASGFTLAMVGAPWRDSPDQPGSDEISSAVHPWFDALMEMFGPRRCMFASNFPIEKTSVSYVVLWNSFKKLASRLSANEADALFAGTADEVYGLGLGLATDRGHA